MILTILNLLLLVYPARGDFRNKAGGGGISLNWLYNVEKRQKNDVHYFEVFSFAYCNTMYSIQFTNGCAL